MKKQQDWHEIDDVQLCKALTLMVRPEWLRERKVAIAMLEALDYKPDDVREVLAGGQPLHDGRQLDFGNL